MRSVVRRTIRDLRQGYFHGMRNWNLIAIMALANWTNAQAQGCSDAGVCTSGSIGQLHLWQDSMPDAGFYRNNARITYSYAVGEQKTTIMQIVPEVNVGIGERLSLQAKIPYVSASGNLGSNSGIGDLVITSSYAFIKEDERHVSGTLGLRLPTGSTDKSIVENTVAQAIRPLPMPYQTGLGTTDLLAGIEWRHKRYVAAIAYQHVLAQNNRNAFTHIAWENADEALGYFESSHLERADDAVIRLQYAYGCGRLALQPGLLAIYHMSNDTRLEQLMSMDPMMQRVSIAGSQGLTLNGTVDLRYKLSDRWAVEFSGGMPFITRKVRPDGLTREFVLNTGLRFRF